MTESPSHPIQIGSVGTLKAGGTFTRPYGGSLYLPTDTVVEITRLVGAREAWVKLTTPMNMPYGGRAKPTVIVRQENLIITAAAAPKPKARKLMEKPEDGDHISVDDPRIAWIWEDIAKHAQTQRYCSEFDRITTALGLPGREREISITMKINNVTIGATARARSPKEAEAKIRAQLGLTTA
jgi:hypothetical protein